jgi:16S rRNA (uracil1498-N3)-methyltransferase
VNDDPSTRLAGAPRFHCPGPLEAGRFALPEAVFHHAVRVRRLRAGDALVLFDGEGREALARLEVVGRDAAEVGIERVATIDRESPLAIALLQGISSGDRMDYTLQKAVELGVTAILPVAMERSIVRLSDERAEKRVAHWREVVVSACEQCGRNRVPSVMPVRRLDEALAAAADRKGFVLSTTATRRLRELERPGTGLALLAGPEGGLAPHETALAMRAGFEALSLGPRVLRTETAAVAALAAMQALWGDG